jgi:hypothetical protein
LRPEIAGFWPFFSLAAHGFLAGEAGSLDAENRRQQRGRLLTKAFRRVLQMLMDSCRKREGAGAVPDRDFKKNCVRWQ